MVTLAALIWIGVLLVFVSCALHCDFDTFNGVASLIKWFKCGHIVRRVREIAKSDYFLRHVCPSAWNSSAPTGRIFIKFDIWGFFENLWRKFKLYENRTGVKVTLHLDQFTFFIMSLSFLLKMRNVSDRFVEKIKTHILCLVTFFRKSCRLWDNVEKYCKAGQAKDDMSHALCIGHVRLRARAHARTSTHTHTHAHTHARAHTLSHSLTHSLTICNTHCFSTTKMVARTRLNVTLYVHCLPCYRFSDFGHPWGTPCTVIGDKGMLGPRVD
jgi:hypothetical protein